MTQQEACEGGYHGALVAAPPIIGEHSVEIDQICPHCGAIEYVVSYTKAAWAQQALESPSSVRRPRNGSREGRRHGV